MSALATSNESKLKDAATVLAQSEVWDLTLPWLPIYWDLSILARYRRSGFTFVSATLQDWPPTLQGTRECLHRFRDRVKGESWLRFANCMEDIDLGRQNGQLVMGFNSQETCLIGENLSNLQTLRELGIRHMLLAYNVRNLVADGCAEAADAGLSNFGRQVVLEMNSVGILVDCSHTGRRSSLEAIEISQKPVIFSHSNSYSVCPHIRNIHDDQIRACAEKNGVIGVVGVGAYLGDLEARTEAMFRHIDYLVSLVGWEHVGLGTDFVDIFPSRDHASRWEAIWNVQKAWPDPVHAWPDRGGSELPADESRCFGPEQLLALVAIMQEHGYPMAAMRGILAGNFRRVYSLVM